MSPLDWLVNAAKHYPSRTALITSTRHLEFKSLFDELAGITSRLLDNGVVPAKPLAVVTRHQSRIAYFFYLSLYTGFPLLPLDPFRESHLKILTDLGIEQIVADAELESILSETCRTLSAETLLDTSETTTAPSNPVVDDEVRLLIPTSGTSGIPKVVMLSSENLITAVESSRKRVWLEAGNTWLCCLPLYHIGGLSIFLRALQAGATVLLHEEFEPELIWADLNRYNVTHLSLVPAMLSRLLDYRKDVNCPDSLRVVLVGGGPLSHQLARRARSAGWPICVTFGMSETTAQVATLCALAAHWQKGDVGRPLERVRVDIVDESGHETSGHGRIRISGPTVMMGYANAQGLSGVGLTDGGFISNDLGYMSSDGHLHVIGRLDDMLITGGENIHPQEIEDNLLSLRDVEDVAITAYSDEVWGQCLVACVTGAIHEAELHTWCTRHLPSALRPRKIIKLKEIPRNSLGKIDRQALRKWVESKLANH